ncbi:tRNA (adenosine(37)-N6)-threonylcarbamoyltransferase complex ATPase subunit type 1 TsaE [Aurantibacter crassamenti]|uniref:tRNA (adenosine(37)-N6)-threonylcarbamoyltransferase complex ATPase subunit type 1 TsaE n=1 Tax=Aurantibacter crassamenti TaxID=1837375 RepID=UPI001939342C|nr:tRNA (adenosine(37)-N6)-threonylcarbamoyltransferase complex ATPase subunit type 1 TsaE [Aurantibacter crassamenti]MBM1106981.1 tRNA (adenosine(37)-N6)-threonylcarbamoyltransferase complex ATPase subunit type 1 TsaE [Aurantibacter crassamenti]
MQLLYSLDQIDSVAKGIIQNSAFKTLCFYAEMGAGKTTLIKSLVKELGGGTVANSPTFGIVNEYHKEDGELLGYHFDFYRLKDETEALDLGFEDYLSQDVWIFIEWPEKINSYLPDESTNITIDIIDDVTRNIELQ